MNNGFDNLADSWIEGGKRLWIKPATVSNNLVGGWYVPDSYYLKTASNISATIHLQATGDLQSTNSTDNVSGLHGDGHGNWNTTTDTVGGGSLKEASYTLATLPTTNEQDGSHLWCSDCTLNGISGVEAYWHSSSKWTDSQNNTLGN
ncbi:hypothetical protein GMO_24950 [Gluconobacter morbifer G707]|uniref:Uncharacterized protein n=2 Tax=Gluconobacter TaxID=441 RepID=G6XL72_9PROT|nr:hypothetical protein GMO_24950 [Gluconobacter morbifer G707]